MDVNVAFQIAAECMENGGYRRQESQFCAEGEERLRAGGEDGIQQRPFLKEQLTELGRYGEGDVKIGAVWEKFVHLCDPSVNLDLGADRAEAAFAGSGNVADLVRVIWAGERGESETLRISAVYDLPDIEGHVPLDLTAIEGKEVIPVFLEDLFECEGGPAYCLHGRRL